MAQPVDLESIVMGVASLHARRNEAIKRRNELSEELRNLEDAIGGYEVAIRDETSKLWKEAQLKLQDAEKEQLDIPPNPVV